MKHPNPLVVAALALIVAVAAPSRAFTEEPARYGGRIEARDIAFVATQLDGVVAKVLFSGGEAVEEGQPLILLDRFDTETDHAIATARRDAAVALLNGAEREAGRAVALNDRGIASDARRTQSETARAAAAAELAEAQAVLRRAGRDLERTVIRAPIAGRVSRPMTVVGAFVEAEAGPPLARIVALDTVLVAYQVPYAARLDALRDSGAATVEELLSRITLRLELPGGVVHTETARPQFASAEVDPETGAVTVWAEVSNPDALLRPGMPVTVLSTISEATR